METPTNNVETENAMNNSEQRSGVRIATIIYTAYGILSFATFLVINEEFTPDSP